MNTPTYTDYEPTQEALDEFLRRPLKKMSKEAALAFLESGPVMPTSIMAAPMSEKDWTSVLYGRYAAKRHRRRLRNK